uniref:Uncharacterized protein n=1 Tax=Anopheles coluzzii TaxID=1518534 RepID=A0A8W7PNP3_ANOCL
MMIRREVPFSVQPADQVAWRGQIALPEQWRQLEVAERALLSIEQQQPPGQYALVRQDDFDRFQRLQSADHTGDGSEDAPVPTVGDRFGRGRGREEAAIAGPTAVVVHGQLALELERAARDERFAQQDARIVQQVPGGHVVRRVHDHVVRFEQGERVLARELCVVRLDFDLRVELLQLAVQVGQLHLVVVQHADPADTGTGQVEGGRAAEPAGTHHQHGGFLQLQLPLDPDLG